MTDREDLIEEAAAVLRNYGYRHLAGAVEAVFEKALGEATVTPTDDEREAAMDEAWGFRAETRPIQEKWNAQHWFDAGWRAALRAARGVR